MPHDGRVELVNHILEDAIELCGPDQEAYVIECCGSDVELRSEIFRLLALSNCAGAWEPQFIVDIGPGDVLGERFEIVKQLGSGAAATVYLAKDQVLGPVALKVMRPDALEAAGTAQRMAAELRAARVASHKNLCPAYEAFRFDAGGTPLFAFTMKYVEGETLQSRLRRAPLRPEEALAIAEGLAAGLDTLHSNGVVHCDLKPANIMLAPHADEALYPVILDFGLAICPSHEQARTISGSPQYMAPEQFRSQPVSCAADVYAFGVILFEMISGKLPFPNEDLLDAAIRRNTEEPQRLSAVMDNVPPGWQSAITGALARDPIDRPRSASDVVRILGSSPIRVSARRSPWRCRRRQPIDAPAPSPLGRKYRYFQQ